MSTTKKDLEQGTASPREVAQALFDGLANRDLSGLDRLVDERAIDDFVAIGQFHGRDAIRGFFDLEFIEIPYQWDYRDRSYCEFHPHRPSVGPRNTGLADGSGQ